eukprot:m.129857 g.129857  ORF g.129857 m.129857 type:complete len:560 (-) comp22350_c0_seq1:179-1858(-)
MSTHRFSADSHGLRTPPRVRQFIVGEFDSPFSSLKILSMLASPHQKGLRRPSSAPPGGGDTLDYSPTFRTPPLENHFGESGGRRTSTGDYYPGRENPHGFVPLGPPRWGGTGYSGQGQAHQGQGGHPSQPTGPASVARIMPHEMQWGPVSETDSYRGDVTPLPTRRRSSAASDRSASDREPASGGSKQKQSRKDKSLGLLSENFLKMFTGADHAEICLDEVAKELGVERRRIYDIVNVLEGVEVVMRKEKNRYTWLGLSGLVHTLSRLKGLAGASAVPEANKGAGPRRRTSSDAASPEAASPDAASSAAADDNLTDKQKSSRSLGILAQRFVMMFMSSPTRVVRLEDAAECLVFQGCDEAKHKTKVRRLYDIANVLCSLKLIAKTSVSDSKAPKKPGFRWIGIDLDAVTPDSSGVETRLGVAAGRTRARKQSLLRAQDDMETPTSKRSRTRLYSPPSQDDDLDEVLAETIQILGRASGKPTETPMYRPWGSAEPAARRNVYGYPTDESVGYSTTPPGSKYRAQQATPLHGRPRWPCDKSPMAAAPGDKRPLEDDGDVFD